MEKYLYLVLDIFSFMIPFLFSFERKRMHFIQHFKAFFSAITMVGLFFITWDIMFAYLGVWSFNEKYIIGYYIMYLPIEEWLFFLLIPYSSIFIHYALKYFLPKFILNVKTTQYINLVLFITSTIIVLFNINKIYTFCSLGLFSVLMLLQLVYKWQYLQRFLISFLLILIPFLIVNSVLTGFFTPEAVVMYDNNENLGIRVGSIPVEDFFYCFSLMYSIVLVFEKLKKK